MDEVSPWQLMERNGLKEAEKSDDSAAEWKPNRSHVTVEVT